jgi:anti-anti-sigma regulatory factor
MPLWTAMVMRIEQTATQSEVIFTLIGRITSPDVQQLKAEIDAARKPIALDLQQVRLVDLDAVYFLAAAERKGIVLRQVPPYVREWILLEKSRVAQLE